MIGHNWWSMETRMEWNEKVPRHLSPGVYIVPESGDNHHGLVLVFLRFRLSFMT